MPKRITRFVSSLASRTRLLGRSPRRTALIVGSLMVVAGLAGTGLTAQSVAAAQAERASATAVLSQSTGLHTEQLSVYGTMLKAHAAHAAETTVSAAAPVIAAAAGKADAAALIESVDALDHHALLATARIFELTRKVQADTVVVHAAIVEADRVAAEKAAADLAAASTPSGAQAIARDMMAAQYGWGAGQFGCLVSLWQKESSWNVSAHNASSGATGIPQALPGSKMATAGADWQTNPATQISWGLGYIAGAYGTPCSAWSHSQSVDWY